MSDLISVIVPVYNVENYLRECLDSIINQTYQHLEIILIDDGSTDSSGNICDEYAKKDSRIVVAHRDNKGVSGARNVGIELSKGEYITFVDSDDAIHEKFLEKLYDAIKQYNVNIAVSNYYVYNEMDNLFYYHHVKNEGVSLFNHNDFLYHLFKQDEIGLALGLSCGKLYARELFDLIRFPLGRVHEDTIVVHKLFLSVEQFVFVHRVDYLYRKHSNSIMNSTDKLIKRLSDLCIAHEEKIVDMLLRNMDVEEMLNYFIGVLNFCKYNLEIADATNTDVYFNICYKLKCYEDNK